MRYATGAMARLMTEREDAAEAAEMEALDALQPVTALDIEWADHDGLAAEWQRATAQGWYGETGDRT